MEAVMKGRGRKKDQEKEPRRDYRVYVFGWKDWTEFAVQVLLKSLMISYLFYDSVQAVLLYVPFAVMDYRGLREKKEEQQRAELTKQFKSVMEALVTSLNAGYSLEHAFGDAKRDLALAYNPNAVIFEELDTILQGLRMNIPLEKLMRDFAQRSGIEDIRNFANVVSVAKKSGGNLIRIIGKTVNSISDKLAVEEEIKTMIAAKKLEQQIMMLMPYGILFYLRMANGGFLGPLYHNPFGIIVMTSFLGVIYGAGLWAKRIMEIRV